MAKQNNNGQQKNQGNNAATGAIAARKRRRGKAAKATSSQPKPLSKIPIPKVGTKIVKGQKPATPATAGAKIAPRRVKLIKPSNAASPAPAGTKGQPKPTKAILKNIKSYVSQNIVKPGRPNPSPAPAAPKPKAINRVGVPKVTGSYSALQTAASIAANPAHPRNKDVRELLNSFEKGWIEEDRFKALLQGMVV